MRTHSIGNTMANQNLGSPITLLLDGDKNYIGLDSISVRLLVEITGMATGQEKTINLFPTIENNDGTTVYYLTQQQKTVPSGNINALILSDIIPLVMPSLLTATKLKCTLSGVNCGTSVTIATKIVIIDENVEYVNGTEPLGENEITQAVNIKKTF